MAYLLGNGTVITVDQERRIITDGAVVTRGNEIIDLGKTREMREKYPDTEFIDASEHIIMPGFIDGHVHLAQAMIRGCADDLNLIDWLAKRVWKLQGNYTEEDGKASAELCILEMLKSGTTTFAETLLATHYGFEGIIQTILKSGIRGALAKSIMDLSTYATKENIMDRGMVEDGEKCFAEALEMHKKWEGAGDDRVFIWLGPRPVGSSTKELLERVGIVSRERNMGIHIHFCEVKEDVHYIREHFNMGPGDFAEKIGLLGPKTLLVHGVWIEEEDIDFIKKHSATVVHNPTCNMKVASGFSPVPRLLEKGVNVSLGCDGGPSNNTYDMLWEMKMAACIHKGKTLDPEVVPAEKVIEMATINGAKSLGLDHLIGSLEKGKRADIVTIDCTAPHLVPDLNPVSTVVYAANGQDINHVLVNGQMIVKQGEILTMDEEEILYKVRVQARKLLAKTNINVKSSWPTL